MRNTAKTIRIGTVIAAVIAYACSAIVPSKTQHRVLILADRPTEITPAFQVGVLNADGDSGIRIPADTGHGWNKKGTGSAGYRFYVPSEGTYTLWAYCLWGDPCTNAVYVQMDNAKQVILGNDPVYLQWHWARGMEYPLSPGTHDLKLSNHSDGISIQRLMLLSDPIEHPSGIQEAYYDIFQEGFDGCDGGNFGIWELSTSNWQLAQPEGKRNFAQRFLQGTAPADKDAEPAVAAAGDNTWNHYVLNLSLQVRKPGTVGVCFDWQGPKDYYAVQWSQSAENPTSVAQAKLVRMTSGRLEVLGTAPFGLPLNKWHELGLTVENGELIIRMNNRDTGRLAFSEMMKGKIGLLVFNGCTAWFDNIHVRRTTTSGR